MVSFGPHFHTRVAMAKPPHKKCERDEAERVEYAMNNKRKGQRHDKAGESKDARNDIAPRAHRPRAKGHGEGEGVV